VYPVGGCAQGPVRRRGPVWVAVSGTGRGRRPHGQPGSAVGGSAAPPLPELSSATTPS